MGTEKEKPFLLQLQEFMNRRDKEYFQSFVETSVPSLIALVYAILMIGVFSIIWGGNPPQVLVQLAFSVFFLIVSFTGVIIIKKRRTTGAFFTVQPGKSAIIVGLLWVFFSLLVAFASLELALESILGG